MYVLTINGIVKKNVFKKDDKEFMKKLIDCEKN